MKKILFSIAVLFLFIFEFTGCLEKLPVMENSQMVNFPQQKWKMYVDPEEGGFSKIKLSTANQFWDSLQSSACIIIHNGIVVAAWGDVERRFMCHSIRKSLLSALYGIFIDTGKINLLKTLGEMGIDDKLKLTEKEKTATILDLLKSASGVYLPAVSEALSANKPPRGSHKPGTFMYYNNWDFNVLGTIFEAETNSDIFYEFQEKIAKPLQMQDYRIRDGYHSYQFESIHPAYIFRMSTRDLARFGLLYLNKGLWNTSRIVSEKWINESTSKQINVDNWMGYGYLWWVPQNEESRKLGLYEALGVGEQAIEIIPSENLVVVLRTNTFDRKVVSRIERYHLLKLILNAKCENILEKPSLIDLPELNDKPDTVAFTPTDINYLCSKPSIQNENSIVRNNNELIIKTPYGNFGLLKTKDKRLILEDKLQEVIIERNSNKTIKRIITSWSLNEEGRRHLDTGNNDIAIKEFILATKYYPEAIEGYLNLGEAYILGNKTDLAIGSYERAHSIDPENYDAIVRLRKLKFVMPDDLAAQWAKDYFHTINENDSAKYIEYLKEYTAEDDLKKVPPAERISDYKKAIAEFGRIEPVYVVKKSALEIYILIHALRSGSGFIFQFKLTDDNKKGKKQLAIRGPHPLYLSENKILEIVGREW